MADKLDFDPVTRQLYGMGANQQFFGMMFRAAGPGIEARAAVEVEIERAMRLAEETHMVKIKEPRAWGPYFDAIDGWYYAVFAEVRSWQPGWRQSKGAKIIMGH